VAFETVNVVLTYVLIHVVALCRTITDLLHKYGHKREAKASRKYGGYFRNDADHRDYVGIGTAAGQHFLISVYIHSGHCYPKTVQLL
jgi:hypothetical protein